MSEIFWVCGTSAVGKEAFITAAQTDASIQGMLGWTGKIIRPCMPSIEFIGQFEGDPITQNREQIISDVVLGENADIVLIKWQFVDFKAKRTQRLKDACPTARHRLIWLMADNETIRPRLVTKSWWQNGDDELEFIASEQDLLKKSALIDPVFDDVTKISSGRNFQYKIMK